MNISLFKKNMKGVLLMPRNPMPVATTRKHLTAREKQIRKNVENKLKVKSDKLKPPDYLNEEQKIIFNDLLENLLPTDILSNLDQTTLEQAAIIIDRLKQVDKQLNEPANIFNINSTNIRQKYFLQYLKICSELALSPAARAKMGAMIADDKDKEKDPLMKAMKGDK